MTAIRASPAELAPVLVRDATPDAVAVAAREPVFVVRGLTKHYGSDESLVQALRQATRCCCSRRTG